MQSFETYSWFLSFSVPSKCPSLNVPFLNFQILLDIVLLIHISLWGKSIEIHRLIFNSSLENPVGHRGKFREIPQFSAGLPRTGHPFLDLPGGSTTFREPSSRKTFACQQLPILHQISSLVKKAL